MVIPFKANDKLLFIGDSITDCGRARPVGRRSGNGLGTGYVSFIDSILGAAVPEKPLRVLNTGISGNRVIDLEARWKSDVIELKPSWLSIMIGINDVWRHFDGGSEMAQVDIETYESIYRGLIEKTLPSLDGLIIMSPFFLEFDRSEPMRAMMDQYGAVSKKLAEECGAVFVDVQVAFDRYLEYQPTETLAEDRVHPSDVGHMIIAQAFLEALV